MAVSALPVRDSVKECYDPQCNCSSSRKELVLHNQHISKLPRVELENRFLHVYEDNIRLKTDCNHLRDQLKRLSTRVFRLIETRKNVPFTGAGGFERQALSAEMLLSEQAQHIATLEAENEIWRAKVESMRQQFLSCRSFTNFRPKNTKKCNSIRHEQWYLEEEIERLKENLKKMERTVNILRNGGDPNESSSNISASKGKGKGKAKDNHSPQLDESGDKTDLEEERARVNSDVELIKAKRLLMAQAQQLAALKERAKTIEQELAGNQKALEEKTRDCEEMNDQLKKNVEKIAELQREIADLHQYQQKVKDLTEQILELKVERDGLKAHNSQLLQLSTAAVSSNRSAASEDPGHATGESLAALQLRVSTLENALGAEKAERLTAETVKENEHTQITQLHQQNEELIARQKELEESLKAERAASASIHAYKKETENLKALKVELESKVQILENELKEKEEPCKKCLQLEKELEVAKLRENNLGEIYRFASLEEENTIVDMLRKLQKFRDQNCSSPSLDLFQNGGDGPAMRYPTLDQTRSVLGLPKPKHEDKVNAAPSTEAGQGDHQRSSSKRTQIDSEDITGKNDAKHDSNKNVPTTVVSQPPQKETDIKYLETVQELEKCQEQLRVQENINKLYREEIDALAKEILTHTGKYSSSPEN